MVSGFLCYFSETNFEPMVILSAMFHTLISPATDRVSPVRLIVDFLTALFLFTKSDIKTILIPVTIFAVSTAPLHSRSSLPHLILWIWLHLLQCALANQSLNPDEDAINKPDRPIPSGRVTLLQAKMLRWINIPVCFGLSAQYSLLVFKSSVALVAFLYIYNDLEFNNHWLSRNILNGAGLACFEIGATLIAGHDRNGLDITSKLAILVSCSIFVTTIHAQDFKDELGDAKIGRRTLPMIFPVASRISLLFVMVAWSIFLSYLWKMSYLAASSMLGLAVLVGVRFSLLKSVSDDQKSFYIYNLWISAANALPALTARAFA